MPHIKLWFYIIYKTFHWASLRLIGLAHPKERHILTNLLQEQAGSTWIHWLAGLEVSSYRHLAIGKTNQHLPERFLLMGEATPTGIGNG